MGWMSAWLLLGRLARAEELPACDDEIREAVQRLEATLQTIRPGLTELLPDLQPIEPAAYFVSDEGDWYGIRAPGRPRCALFDGRVVTVRKGRPLPGTGFASWSRGSGALAVGTHDEARDGWDLIGWQAIVAHEWVHLHHFSQAEPSTLRFRDGPLVRRFEKDEAFREAVLALAGTAYDQRAGCDDPGALASAWDEMQGMLSARQRQRSEAWLLVEGLGRYFEATWEGGARAVDPEQLRLEQCRSLDTDAYGYAVGCLVAVGLDACLGPDWMDAAWSAGFEPAIARLR